MTRTDRIDLIDMSSSGPASDDRGAAAVRWSARGLVAVTWISATIFGLYIIAYYVGAAYEGTPDQWNERLPRLYDPQTAFATIGIGAHFLTGAILLLFGPVQLIGAVRRRAPRLHRWMGRIYVSAALLTGLGGLMFIAKQGTIGGAPMSVGFSLYGALMVVASVATVWRARQRRFQEHRAWAIRLFALTIGSWLYRMDYGLWHVLAHNVGHTRAFNGPFDLVMFFFFYIPNLIVAEAFIRARQPLARPAANIAAATLLNGATVFLAIATYYFTVSYWGAAIVNRIVGASS
jgi:hypothetical protein